LNYSPSLFYKDYILQDREEKTEKYLIEGKLVHLLLFEPQELNNKFNIVPGKTPSDGVIKVLKAMSSQLVLFPNFDDVPDSAILDALKECNLHQALKEDEARVAKVRTDDVKDYWSFMSKSKLDVIDPDILARCQDYVETIKSNKDVMELFADKPSDFELDPIKAFSEHYLECSLNDRAFGLKGFLDFFKIDSENKTVTICDLKTTSKTISDFGETLEFYNYWMQAAIYYKLVLENLDKSEQDYKIIFKFVVIDKYNQVYVFDVSDETMAVWGNRLSVMLDQADYHYNNNNYSLPYQFLFGNVTL